MSDNEEVMHDDDDIAQLRDSKLAPVSRMASCVSSLRLALSSERFAPDLLAFESDSLSLLKSMIDIQESLVEDSWSFVDNLKRQEIDRLRFLLKSYLRIRLSKIEENCRFILSTYPHRLSFPEKKFAENMLSLEHVHYNDVCGDHLPKDIQALSTKPASSGGVIGQTLLRPPKKDEYCFGYVLQKMKIPLPDEDVPSFELLPLELYIFDYSHIVSFVESKKIILV